MRQQNLGRGRRINQGWGKPDNITPTPDNTDNETPTGAVGGKRTAVDTTKPTTYRKYGWRFLTPEAKREFKQANNIPGRGRGKGNPREGAIARRKAAVGQRRGR